MVQGTQFKSFFNIFFRLNWTKLNSCKFKYFEIAIYLLHTSFLHYITTPEGAANSRRNSSRLTDLSPCTLVSYLSAQPHDRISERVVSIIM